MKKQRQNFFPAFLASLFLWILIGIIIFIIPPISNWIIFIFLLFFFLALFLTTSLLFANSRRGGLLSFFIVLFLVLRLLKIGHLLNLFLLTVLFFTLEIYFSKR